MGSRRGTLAIVAAAVTVASPGLGQVADTAAPRLVCTKHATRAMGQALFVNVVVNRLDAWGRGQGWAYTGTRSWGSNLRLGWQWDEDHFGTNLFSHPYHGGLYLNAGRDNCLTFWESAPLAFLGSWTWEYFGEKFRPSLNDFFMTSFGGIALGEVFHRVGATVRDNRARGRGRVLREVASMMVDPIGGLNRLFRGEWTRVGPNPPEHDPGAFMFRFHAGGRVVSESASFSHPTGSATMVVDLSYGDPFERPFHAPFDVFNARVQLSSGGGAINMLRAAGLLYQHELTGPGARHRHLFVVNQRFDFVNNAAYRFGGQSIEAAILSRWRLGNGDKHLRAKVAGDAILLGAIDAPYTGFGERTYDFGPGLGLMAELALERNEIVSLEWYNRLEYLHSVSGASADHYVLFTGLEGTLGIGRGMGLGLCLSTYARSSRYTDKGPDDRKFPELRMFVTWTAARGPGRGVQP